MVQRNGNGLRAFCRAHRYVRALDLCFFTGTFRARLWHGAPLLRGDLLTLLAHTCLAVGKQARAMKQTGDGEVSCWGLRGNVGKSVTRLEKNACPPFFFCFFWWGILHLAPHKGIRICLCSLTRGWT